MAQEEKDKVADKQVENENVNPETEANPEPQAENTASETEALKLELAELKDKYLRMFSEFDNFRKRTAKERIDLVKTANEDVIKSILPVLDDFERAMKSLEGNKEAGDSREGIELIHHKLLKNLEQKGLKAMTAVGEPFNPELHEAITQIPATSEDMKGKVIDEVEKGYFLHDKVIRFAKVVTGA